MFAHTNRKPGSLRNAALFAAVPLLASGPILSCKCEPSQEPPAPVEIPSAPYRSPPRADSSFRLGYTVGCPEWMVRAADQSHEYCIDRFEAYAVENRGGIDIPHPSSVAPAKLARLIARAAPGMRPQSSVSRMQAEDACENAGKRLCTLSEWKSACQGVQGFTYPYGDIWEKGRCNTHKEHVISRLFGKDWGKRIVDAPETNMIKGFLAKSGEHHGCVSSYGTFDMVGNLHEWVSTPVDERIAASRPRLNPAKNTGFRVVPGNGIFMGGFYATASQNGDGCHYMTIVHGPQQNDYSVGFRCCKDADSK